MTPTEVFIQNLPWLFVGMFAAITTLVAMIPAEDDE